MIERVYPCDEDVCPYDAESGNACAYWCGLGVDEDSVDLEQ